jgi:histidinol-phosphate/aromatic aminotransferase/cobyric acid decarboxylase-like protein
VHGGASFAAIGADFADLDRRRAIVDADVLDAWYPPAPSVVQEVAAHLEWLMKTSPPTHSEGLRAAIASHVGLPDSCILPGGGTSPFIFSALPRMVSSGDRVCILDPMYGEYRHVLENLVGAEVVSVPLAPERDFRVDPQALLEAAKGCRLVIVVNPNSPTGQCLSRDEWEEIRRGLPETTRVWVDETYIDFAPGRPSVEPWVADDPRFVVAKSLSKFFALSGLRVGYLAADSAFIREVERFTPPWSVGTLAQVAAVRALEAYDYYQAKASETHALRQAMSDALDEMPGLRCVGSVTNFLMFEAPSASALVEGARKQGVYLRDCGSLSQRFADRYVRTAVKSAEENGRIIEAIGRSAAP